VFRLTLGNYDVPNSVSKFLSQLPAAVIMSQLLSSVGIICVANLTFTALVAASLSYAHVVQLHPPPPCDARSDVAICFRDFSLE